MKMNFSTLIALGLAGLVSTAAAQPADNNPAPPEAAAPGAENASGAPPDFGNLPPPPSPEVIAQITADIQQANQQADQPAEKNNSPRETTSIQPSASICR